MRHRIEGRGREANAAHLSAILSGPRAPDTTTMNFNGDPGGSRDGPVFGRRGHSHGEQDSAGNPSSHSTAGRTFSVD